MGRKVHPFGFRLGINQPWGGRWFAEGAQYRQQLHQDFAIRNLLIDNLMYFQQIQINQHRKVYYLNLNNQHFRYPSLKLQYTY